MRTSDGDLSAAAVVAAGARAGLHTAWKDILSFRWHLKILNKAHQKNTETSSPSNLLCEYTSFVSLRWVLAAQGASANVRARRNSEFHDPKLLRSGTAIDNKNLRDQNMCTRTAHNSTEAEANPRITRNDTCLFRLQAHKTRTRIVYACILHYPSSSVAVHSCIYTPASYFQMFLRWV